MKKTNNALEIMESKEDKYREYEELLLRRDQLYRECGSLITAYTCEFGDQLARNFELKVECIKKKKAISYCLRRRNRGLTIDATRMHAEIEQEMTLYYEQLREMQEDSERAKKAGTISEFRLNKSKRIYRRLAKLLHPDINHRTMENERLRELWERIAEAYRLSDAEMLDDLEAMVRRAMDELGYEGSAPIPDDIEERIERIENQINRILTTEPYTYRELLSDEEKKQAYMERLISEQEDYEQYLENLTKKLEDILREGGATILWQMN